MKKLEHKLSALAAKIAIPVLGLLTLSFTSVGVGKWKADKSHTAVNFTIIRFNTSEIYGSFDKIEAQFTSAKEDFTDAVFEFSADVNSIDTNEEKRDAHLKSPDFFDVTKFNSITFKSTGIKKIDSGKYMIVGDLTLHGVTKSAAFDATITHGTNTRIKQDFVAVSISGSINRKAFAIAESIPDAIISEQVIIKGNASFVKE